MFKLKNSKGFTLAETLVASGLMGIIALGVIMGADSMKKTNMRSRHTNAISSNEAEALKRLKNYTQGLSWKQFDKENSYTAIPEVEKFKKAGSPTASAVTFEAEDGISIDFTRDSHTIITIRGDKKILYASRCVATSIYENRDLNQSFTLQQIKNFTKRPYVVRSNVMDKNEVECCDAEVDETCGENYPRKKNNTHRVMTFFYTQDNSIPSKSLRFYPVVQERDYMLGMGFMAYLDKESNATQLMTYSFVISNQCYTMDSDINCDKQGLLKQRAVSAPLTADSVYDSGTIIIR